MSDVLSEAYAKETGTDLRYLSPLRYFGSKARLVPLLLSRLPNHRRYVEPFAGGASLFFAKRRAEIEVLNDLDGNVANFYGVLQRDEERERLHGRLFLAPYARSVFEEARERVQAGFADDADPVERAYWWLISQGMSYAGNGESWSYSTTLTRRDNLPASVAVWWNRVDRLSFAARRLHGVEVESQHFRQVIPRYDSPETLYYCDPPYIPDTRTRGGYAVEMTTEEHEELVSLLLAVRGRVLLSGYDHPIYSPLVAAGWSLETFATVAHTNSNGGRRPARLECLWSNPAAARASARGTLFDDKDEA